METINYKGKELKIRYQHRHMYQPENLESQDYPDLVEGKYRDRLVIGHTRAYLIDEGEVVEEAYAYCSEQDVFNKKLGRTIARGRLIKKISED